ncbi:OmpA family protein [Alistipes indistinctus]|uniref:OmpA family protein n=1 Tax=Alistipes indistinctus TaxID=626932 RepID=UPI002675D994|nr:OmpA family protein [Alistipes indistinctus]
MNTTNTKQLFLFLLGVLLAGTVYGIRNDAAEQEGQRREGRVERSADLNFIKGNPQRAMAAYKRAYNRMNEMCSNERLNMEQRRKLFGDRSRLALKIARNYMLLQEPEQAVIYYKDVCDVNDTLLTVNDVCFYIDALRRLGDDQQAEIVARGFAFRQPYSNNQRYLNTLASLSDVQHYYGRGDADYRVNLLRLDTPLAEYWLGEWEGKPFYAVSRGRIQDPLKIYYHRTQFFSLYEGTVPEAFRLIPRELQSGPVAFSPDGKTMVATALVYRRTDRIVSTDSDAGLFVNQLYYSRYDDVRKRWSDFLPLFANQEGSSYGHPAFYDDGRSLLFSSDRAGGYGGMDLYETHWDPQQQQWSDPVNMGSDVNTEGDEIYPRVVGDALYFASNGMEGFGGYDIYRMSFINDVLVPGTLFHYLFPVNTVYNDFGIFFDGTEGYFISDRRGAAGKDDIYSFDNTISPLSSESAIGVSAEYSAMVGNLNLISGLGNSNTESFETEVRQSLIYPLPSAGDLLVSVYFDFNSSGLSDEARENLRNVVETMGFNDLNAISVIGYADEFGTEKYNLKLSRQRAMTVAEFFSDQGAKPVLYPEGRGKQKVPVSDFIEALQKKESRYPGLGHSEIKRSPMKLTFQEQIEVTRKARRVDVIVKKQM